VSLRTSHGIEIRGFLGHLNPEFLHHFYGHFNIGKGKDTTPKLDHGIILSKGGADQKGRDVLAALDIREGNPAASEALAMNNHGGKPPFIFASGINSQYFQGIEKGLDRPFTESPVAGKGKLPLSQRYQAGEKSDGGSIISQVDFPLWVFDVAVGTSDDHIFIFDQDLRTERSERIDQIFCILGYQAIPQERFPFCQGADD